MVPIGHPASCQDHRSIVSGHKIGGLAIFRRARSSLSPSRSLRVKEMALDHPLQTEERINAIVPETRLDQQQSIPAQTWQGVGSSAPQLTGERFLFRKRLLR